MGKNHWRFSAAQLFVVCIAVVCLSACSATVRRAPLAQPTSTPAESAQQNEPTAVFPVGIFSAMVNASDDKDGKLKLATGEWQLRFIPTSEWVGVYVLVNSGFVVATGDYSADPQQRVMISSASAACKGFALGEYYWTMAGAVLRLDLVKDDCPQRTALLIRGWAPVERNPSGKPMETQLPNGLKISRDMLMISDSWITDGAPERYTEDEYWQMNRVFTYTIQLKDDSAQNWTFSWCATTIDELRDSMRRIQWSFFVNGRPLSDDQFFQESSLLTGEACQLWSAKLSNWPDGKTELKVIQKHRQTSSNGKHDYGVGTQTFLGIVTKSQKSQGG